jgi:hypothetical protein
MLTDSDSLLYRVLTKTLPDAFLQRVLGTDIFTSNSGLRLYYYLCNTSPHDRSQRLLTLRKTLYLQNGCKDKTKLASVLQMWYSMYKELLEDVNAASLDTVQLLTALKTLVAPQMNEELRGLTLAQHLANELAVIRRMLRVALKPMRDLNLEEYFEVCRDFAIELQSTTAQHNHAKSFQSLLGHDDDESAHCNMALGKGGRGTGGKGGGKGGKGGGKVAVRLVTDPLPSLSETNGSALTMLLAINNVTMTALNWITALRTKATSHQRCWHPVCGQNA